MRGSMVNALTFDVEEYFHAEAFAGRVRPEEWPSLESRVVRATERILELLAEAGVRATFFVLGWVAERHPGLIRAIDAEGHEVASHGYGHEMVTRLSRSEFTSDLVRAKAILEDVMGRPVVGYRAPTFSVVRETLWCLDVLAETGFLYDSSIFPIIHDRYGMVDAPRFPHRRKGASGASIAEFPLSTVSWLGWRLPVAGGGYFRVAPYPLSAWALRRLNRRENQPAIVYLHPWELDSGSPTLPANWTTRLRHCVHIGSTESKLRALLRDFRFAPVQKVLTDSGVLPKECLS